MKNLIRLIILSISLLSISVFCQEDKINKVDLTVLLKNDKGIEHRENLKLNTSVILVSIDDKNLKNFIKSLNLEQYCLRKGEYWYINYSRPDGIIVLSKQYIQNLIHLSQLRNSQLYLTLIDDIPLFVLNKSQNKNYIITGLKLDLREYNHMDYRFGTEQSFWYLIQNEKTLNIIDYRIYDCD